MDQPEESLFEEALNRYKAGFPADKLIIDFLKITSISCRVKFSEVQKEGGIDDASSGFFNDSDKS